MARVITQAEAIRLDLPGRTALEIVSARVGARSMTLRLVEIPPQGLAPSPRRAHHHEHCEECTFVLSGTGTTYADSGEYPLTPGDTIFIPPGEKHATRNTGTTPLVLLCFLPIADMGLDTIEPDAQTPPRGSAP
ncbi:MAG: cupin domain-containing protein [Acidobacteriota bacterium]